MSLSFAIKCSYRAIKTNFLPGVSLQLLSLAIILSYYYSEPLKAFWDEVSSIKNKGGVFLAMLSTGVFGGIFPSFIQQFSKSMRQKNLYKHLPFGFLFWAYKGFEIDLLYKLQAKMFGDDHQTSTIIYKVFVDQFVYVPTLGGVSILFAYLWKENNYKLKGMSAVLGEKWYINKALPMIVSCWFVWIPTVCVIYSLPLSLQLPVQNLILCFWSLIVIFLTNKPAIDEMPPVANA